MTLVAELRQGFIDGAANRFDQAVHYFREMWEAYPEEVELLVEYWDEFQWEMSYLPNGSSFGSIPWKYLYPFQDDVQKGMEFVLHFVGHELNDDGEPALVYLVKKAPPPPRLKDDQSIPEALVYRTLPTLEAYQAWRKLWNETPWVSVPPEDPAGIPVLLRGYDVAFEEQHPETRNVRGVADLRVAFERARQFRYRRHRATEDEKIPADSDVKQKLRGILAELRA